MSHSSAFTLLLPLGYFVHPSLDVADTFDLGVHLLLVILLPNLSTARRYRVLPPPLFFSLLSYFKLRAFPLGAWGPFQINPEIQQPHPQIGAPQPLLPLKANNNPAFGYLTLNICITTDLPSPLSPFFIIVSLGCFFL